MESKKSAFPAESLLIGSLLVIALLVTAIAIIPNWRESVLTFFGSEKRTILAKVSGDLTGQGFQITVLKIEMRDGLILEVYHVESSDQTTLMTRIPLPEKRDAYFQLKGNATNLGLVDMDHDGTLEIFAPTFDDQMVARLNVYKFNESTRSFDRVNAPSNTEF